MNDQLFPSGPWVGFYNYGAPTDKHRMDLHLTFADGQMTGDGSDDIGRFLISGRYDSTSLECYWTKTYPGSHDVYYRGFREGKGIWGTWEIKEVCRGGFHIWPRNAGEGEEETRESSEPEPVFACADDSAQPQPLRSAPVLGRRICRRCKGAGRLLVLTI